MNSKKSKKVFVYKLKSEDKKIKQGGDSEIEVVKWAPGITSFIPPNSSISYFYFWIAHYLNFFKTHDYCAFAIYKQKQPICSLVCIPALYRWSFMKPGDLQIKNVFTHEKYRGQGFAFALIQYALQEKMGKDMVFWYMTNEDNVPSQKLCKKIGFQFVGEYVRKRNNFFIYKGKILKTENNPGNYKKDVR